MMPRAAMANGRPGSRGTCRGTRAAKPRFVAYDNMVANLAAIPQARRGCSRLNPRRLSGLLPPGRVAGPHPIRVERGVGRARNGTSA